MLSILIPTYNYQITGLVNVLHRQAIDTGIEFEVLCKDDASSKYVEKNKSSVEKLEYVCYFTSDKNMGRTASRQFLCDKAKYDWLLFLDADVIPKTNNFIKNYTNYFRFNYDAVFGGFAYDTTKTIEKGILRWKYGKKFEEVDAKRRNLKPYGLIISANFMIRKDIFNEINPKLNRKGYGLDNYFSALLKQQKAKVLHINNEVYHYGLEDNAAYLRKSEEAIDTLLWMMGSENVTAHNNKLLKTYGSIKKIKLNCFTALLYLFFNKSIRINLLSDSPNIYLLQIYKLLFMSHRDLNQ
ncbi:MAG: glycosyltransferase family 2 protein [Winogradskyella sp.]|uniref:glycosyltransferase family 2 protein n=1 Tax=Winogradskyella sp. TaxID=1883156 RepID=UPI0017FF8E70|nr:glycosyltransferase [Winogradskyella sp.]MBT8243742.1 glycosyltransferase [Winogradskyella sp.]NNK22065.1 glycosyltransferase family 2 protein [Winogradskyella sp.]